VKKSRSDESVMSVALKMTPGTPSYLSRGGSKGGTTKTSPRSFLNASTRDLIPEDIFSNVSLQAAASRSHVVSTAQEETCALVQYICNCYLYNNNSMNKIKMEVVVSNHTFHPNCFFRIILLNEIVDAFSLASTCHMLT
jgi:hypothetical protein